MSYSGSQRRDDRGGRNDPPPSITPVQLEMIISGDGDEAVKMLVDTAQHVGDWLKKMDFSTSQIRNVFGVVREIEQRIESLDSQDRSEVDSQQQTEGQPQPLPNAAYRDLMLLKPKLAYQYGRAGSEGKKNAKDAMGLLQRLLSDSIDLVGRDRDRFTHFVEFFEAILAYHRYYGGKS